MTASYHNLQTEEVFSSFSSAPDRTLLMIAGAAGVIGGDAVDEIAALAPWVTIRTVLEAGHMIPWDRPDGFYAALEGFLPTSIRHVF